jgi:hypothetical protein
MTPQMHKIEKAPMVTHVQNGPKALQFWQSAGHELSRVYAAREDKRFGWCSPSDPNHIKGLYYIKLPKCASSTGAAVMLNIANNVARRKNAILCHAEYHAVCDGQDAKIELLDIVDSMNQLKLASQATQQRLVKPSVIENVSCI